MMEVVFSRSAYGSLKVAQHYGAGEYRGGAVSLITGGAKPSETELRAIRRQAQAQARMEWEQARPMGGDPADLVCLELAWSMGDISDDAIGDGRRAVLERADFVWPPREDRRHMVETALEEARDALRTLLDRSSGGEAVRIWYSHNPDEACGFCWLLAQLGKCSAHGPIYAVKLPEWEYAQENTIHTYLGWGELSPGEWSRYCALQQEVRPALLAACRLRWRQLQEENAPLRVCLNGRLQSAPEDIYDSFLLREMDAQPDEFSQARVIGAVLGKYRLGIGDVWLALRMEQWIQDGRLEVVTTPAPDELLYRRMLRKPVVRPKPESPG